MATVLENLAAAEANFTALLVDMSANPKPSYTVGDRTFSWTEYQQFLLKAIDSTHEAQDKRRCFKVTGYARA